MCGIWQGMLQHTLLKEAGQLEGMYQQALNRICNQVITPYFQDFTTPGM